jgi:hypothetical protein
VASWPGLATVLSAFVMDEVRTKRKGLDPGQARTVRRLVQLAEDGRRTGDAQPAPAAAA